MYGSLATDQQKYIFITLREIQEHAEYCQDYARLLDSQLDGYSNINALEEDQIDSLEEDVKQAVIHINTALRILRRIGNDW